MTQDLKQTKLRITQTWTDHNALLNTAEEQIIELMKKDGFFAAIEK